MGFALGIVGHAAEKFDAVTERLARAAIDDLIASHGATLIVSGRSPMGGVDIWAELAAARHGIPVRIFPPKINRWEGAGGFRERNLLIAANSDHVACVVVATYPIVYHGMRFPGCYHCRGRNAPHVKSGGCWTAWRAKSREWIIIDE